MQLQNRILTDTGRATFWLARRLRELRERCGISQKQLADAAGLHHSVVHQAERGRDARFSTWVRLFEAVGYYLVIDFTETCEEAEDLLREERDRRKERQIEGLCAGKWRFR